MHLCGQISLQVPQPIQLSVMKYPFSFSLTSPKRYVSLNIGFTPKLKYSISAWSMQNLLERPWRFNELKKNLEGISQKVLTDSLRSMENDGLITRTVYPEVPPRVEYALSDLGKSLKPILDSMVEWGNAYKKM